MSFLDVTNNFILARNKATFDCGRLFVVSFLLQGDFHSAVRQGDHGNDPLEQLRAVAVVIFKQR